MENSGVQFRSSLSARLSVVFYIILCFEIGIFLTVLPWWPQGMWGLSDWGNNYFLLYAARKTGQGLQTVVASGWVRGAVTGVGLLNLGIAFWEIFHFNQTVRALDGQSGPRVKPAGNVTQAAATDHLPDNERQNDSDNNS
ncbi:MAG TPA: hypothetical protein VFH91_08285 [Pyrinomonadaceae bacterium]|nr:hypothetical protein [Pyrinomonadaceae bacterium]